MPRLLTLTQTHNVWGGIEVWLDGLCARLDAEGWELYAGLTQGREHNVPARFVDAHPAIGVPLALDARTGTEEARVRAIVRAIAECRPDVVMPLAVGAVFEACRRLRASGGAAFRLVVPVHSFDAAYLRNVVERIDVIDQVGAVNRLVQRYLACMLPSDAARIRYLRHGVPPAHAPRQPRGARLRIGYVGRLDEASKRVSDLVPLCRALRGADVDAEVHVVGDGDAGPSLRGALGDGATGVPEIFHGKLDRAALYDEIYPALDALVLFSPAESGPLVVYEAMLHGVVPVVSDYLGRRSEGVIRHGGNARVFAIGDTAAAARQLAALAGARDELARLAANAKKDAAAYIDDACYRQWESVLRDALAQPPKPAPRAARAPAAPAGRLERLGFPASAAERVRRALGRSFPHADGWAEWPGSEACDDARLAEVARALARLERQPDGARAGVAYADEVA